MEEKEIKEAMIEALTHLEGCKYFVATTTLFKNR